MMNYWFMFVLIEFKCWRMFRTLNHINQVYITISWLKVFPYFMIVVDLFLEGNQANLFEWQ